MAKPFSTLPQPKGYPVIRFLEVVEDRAGNIWIPTYGGGVSKLEKDVINLRNNHL
jgi:hypothetical protein